MRCDAGAGAGYICSHDWFTPFWPDRNSLTGLEPPKTGQTSLDISGG